MSNLIRQPVFRHLWRASGLLPLWALFLAVVAVITLVVGFFVDIEKSAWGYAAQLPPWFLFGLGVYASAVYLPLHITHGHTRKEFLAQALVWVMLLAPAAAALMTLTFGIERLAYQATGWTQAFDDDVDGLFSTPEQYGWIFVGSWLVYLSYMAIGAALGAAFYRQAWHGLAGLLMIPVALVLIVPGSMAGWSGASEVPASLWPDRAAAVTITGSLLAFVVAGSITWAFVRDMPVRSNVP